MYPSFKSLADKENQRKALQAKVQRDLQIEAIRNSAYKNTMWADENIANTINLNPTTTTSSTQTSSPA